MRWDGISAIEKFNIINQSIIELEKERHSLFNVEYYKSPELLLQLISVQLKVENGILLFPHSVIVEGRLGVFPGEPVSDARTAFSNHIIKVSNSDPWLKNNPPIIEWFEGQFESGQTDIDHSIINNLKEAYNNVNKSNPIIKGCDIWIGLATFYNHADIPALLFGPGDVRLAHSLTNMLKLKKY
ncbi:MAG: hypothetical protein CM1200mP1_05520 [Candidatus Neomarinimicrobiota bacterium]|nr:MAG: hypothetical protein CM1200mP1_05520 [Candidatus Neomarinimicrobiota bacterium]